VVRIKRQNTYKRVFKVHPFMRKAGGSGSSVGMEAVMAINHSSGVNNISDERSNHSFITKENA